MAATVGSDSRDRIFVERQAFGSNPHQDAECRGQPYLRGACLKNFLILGATVLGLACLPCANANTIVLTLEGVTFGDGATANGFFDFDPATQTLGSYAVTTTDGLTGGLKGHEYAPGIPGAYAYVFLGGGTVDISIGVVGQVGAPLSARYSMSLDINVPAITAPGTYPIIPGEGASTTAFGHSGEFTQAPAPDFSVLPRLVTAGSITATATVPDTGGTAALLGLAGISILICRFYAPLSDGLTFGRRRT
jgi:hypothetical protein